ncbi:hypothetical protein FRC11_013181 [Ceratobasidium sp. 423]|nr:hypothetical protein FRC11_013181 [Ceratobasidium sp. 423]
MHICKGGDIVCIVATGAGKSALVQGPIAALKVMGKNPIGIVVVPTKGLADNQAQAAQKKNINTLALHQGSVCAAAEEHPGRNLFKEIHAGKWNLVFLSPEMLVSQCFGLLLDDPNFSQKMTRLRT